MPGMTGIELLVELKKRIDIPKRALLTANVQNDIRIKAEEQGVIFLNKPICEDVVNSFLQS